MVTDEELDYFLAEVSIGDDKNKYTQIRLVDAFSITNAIDRIQLYYKKKGYDIPNKNINVSDIIR